MPRTLWTALLVLAMPALVHAEPIEEIRTDRLLGNLAEEQPLLYADISGTRGAASNYQFALMEIVPRLGLCNRYYLYQYMYQELGPGTPSQIEIWKQKEKESFAHLQAWFGYEGAVWTTRTLNYMWNMMSAAFQARDSNHLGPLFEESCTEDLSKLAPLRARWLESIQAPQK